jgi:hypothetical protein
MNCCCHVFIMTLMSLATNDGSRICQHWQRSANCTGHFRCEYNYSNLFNVFVCRLINYAFSSSTTFLWRLIKLQILLRIKSTNVITRKVNTGNYSNQNTWSPVLTLNYQINDRVRWRHPPQLCRHKSRKTNSNSPVSTAHNYHLTAVYWSVIMECQNWSSDTVIDLIVEGQNRWSGVLIRIITWVAVFGSIMGYL